MITVTLDLKRDLSERELQVLRMTFEDKTSREIARVLGLKEKTIHQFRFRILIKTRPLGWYALHALAMAEGVVPVPALARGVVSQKQGKGVAA